MNDIEKDIESIKKAVSLTGFIVRLKDGRTAYFESIHDLNKALKEQTLVHASHVDHNHKKKVN